MPILGLSMMLVMMVLMFRRGCLGMCMPGRMSHGGGEDARDILDRGYARGEIGAEQYRRMRAEINS